MISSAPSPGRAEKKERSPATSPSPAPSPSSSFLGSPGRAEEPASALAQRFAELALACAHREYPNKIGHVLDSDADVHPPRQLTPAFFGCFDWHSAVHGHWLLARLLRTTPRAGRAGWADRATAVLDRSLSPENLAQEAAYLMAPGRSSFERPYGLAWLLQLSAELEEGAAASPGTASELEPALRAKFGRWSTALRPLGDAAVTRLRTWLPKLSRPVRSGEHSQTAFALGLLLDWSRLPRRDAQASARAREFEALLVERARSYFLADKGCPLAYEPSGEDFLSPCLAEADVMRRVLPPPEFARWLDGFLPGLGSPAGPGLLAPAVVTDPTDGKLAHLDGLNLSRAWMLDGIASALAASAPGQPVPGALAPIRALAAAHRQSGLRAVTGEHYEGGHWLGSFAVYLITARGVR